MLRSPEPRFWWRCGSFPPTRAGWPPSTLRRRSCRQCRRFLPAASRPPPPIIPPPHFPPLPFEPPTTAASTPRVLVHVGEAAPWPTPPPLGSFFYNGHVTLDSLLAGRCLWRLHRQELCSLFEIITYTVWLGVAVLLVLGWLGLRLYFLASASRCTPTRCGAPAVPYIPLFTALIIMRAETTEETFGLLLIFTELGLLLFFARLVQDARRRASTRGTSTCRSRTRAGAGSGGPWCTTC